MRSPVQSSISPPPPPLYKQRSWSPDAYRDEAWHRRKKINGRSNLQRSKSVTEEDLDELKACIELGFGFDSPESDQRLANTFPALGLYYAVNKSYCDSVSNKSTATPTSLFSPTPSECDSVFSPIGSPHTIFGPGDTPQTVKTRLRQWAQVVACTMRQSSVAASSMAALKQPTIRVMAIIAEGVPESDTKQLIAYARATNKVVIGSATVGGIQAGAFKIVEGQRISLNNAGRLPMNKIRDPNLNRAEIYDLPVEDKSHALLVEALRGQTKKFNTIVAVRPI
ncbi:hypothetical protein C1H46_029599 [Malus baccata]|uniref:Uncharacterized protein n=1 Tax=Malus baccata TaxID=106549 RepID=A0A540LEC6_MALBA|nr:hypothetical protein C1H46_029599 [Malus baccata]